MRILYHFWLNPYCRKVRLVLHEKQVPFKLHTEKVWERRREFLALNPVGDVPVLVEKQGSALSGSDTIIEYVDEVFPNPPLIGKNPLARAECRRLVYWFDKKFNNEVTEKIVDEKIMKRVQGLGQPDSKAVRAGHHNIHTHLDYVSYLIERRPWLSGDELSVADITAAAHFSTIDYLGDVPWEKYTLAKQWYARIKSRPSFRPILEDLIPGASPTEHYKNLDF